MTLDPIVSLAVAIAEAPGSYAFLLGSGVSRDAGVPTGGEVFWIAVGDLYRLETAEETTPDRDGLSHWLAETDRADLGYSEVLELLAPDAATRRDYLAKHFEGVEPAETHRLLADLAERGLVRVFVTTNFDRLLERALQARGIEPIVVTSEADLAVAPGREHAPCYVLKPHGDYLQQTIRNTPTELAELPPGITDELLEVIARYGIVVLGYSGSDEAISNAMRVRRSRYGLYWVSRGSLTDPARGLVEVVAGRVIERPSASDFLRDLERRLAVFAAHPSGHTPVSLHDEVLVLLQRGDQVGLRELLRRERRHYEDQVLATIESHNAGALTADLVAAVHDDLLPVVERRLGTLLPLVIHEPALLADEIASLGEFRDRQPLQGGLVFWPSCVDWSAWCLCLTVGALMVNERRLAEVSALFEPRVTDHYGSGTEPLVPSLSGEAGDKIGPIVMKRVDDRKYVSPAWEAVGHDMTEMALLQERYPGLLQGNDEPKRSRVEFDLIHTLALRLADDRAIAHWTMYSDVANRFAARLHADSQLRKRLAGGLALTLEELDERAPEALEGVYALGQFTSPAETISILRTGSRG